MIKPAAALSVLLVVPFSATLADDQQTETLHNNSFQESAGLACGYSPCTVSFAATTHVNTAITGVSCSFLVPSGSQVHSVSLSTKNNRFQTVNVPFYYIGTDANNSVSLGVNSQVTYFIKEGDTPTFTVLLSSVLSSNVVYDLNCLISGYHS